MKKRTRTTPYAFALLVAVILSVVPAAIFADLITPLSSWENWSGDAQSRKGTGTSFNPPAVLRLELAVFRTLAEPPSWVREALTGHPTVYGAQFAERGVIYESAGLPPFALAISHIAWALPFWFLIGAVCYEIVRVASSRLRAAPHDARA